MSHEMEELKNIILSLAIYNMVPQPIHFCLRMYRRPLSKLLLCFVVLSGLKILDHGKILISQLDGIGKTFFMKCLIKKER